MVIGFSRIGPRLVSLTHHRKPIRHNIVIIIHHHQNVDLFAKEKKTYAARTASS